MQQTATKYACANERRGIAAMRKMLPVLIIAFGGTGLLSAAFEWPEALSWSCFGAALVFLALLIWLRTPQMQARRQRHRESPAERLGVGATVNKSDTVEMTMALKAAKSLEDVGRTAEADAIYMHIVEAG